MREVLRFLGKWLLRPSSVGALYLLALVALAARDGTEADRALGGQTRAIQHAVERHFGGEIERMTVAIVAVTVLLGALLGTFAGLLLLLRDRVARTPERGPLRQAAVVLAVVAVIHALAETYAMADAPQLYAEAFYAKGGFLRLLQVLLTDDLGRGGVVVLGTLAIFVFLAGPLSQWKRWPARLIPANRR